MRKKNMSKVQSNALVKLLKFVVCPYFHHVQAAQ